MDWSSLKNNPTLATSAALFVAALLLSLWSTAALLGAVFYQPSEQAFKVRSRSEAPAAVDLSLLSSRNFFGEPGSAEEEIIAEDLPETELNLVLRGAFTAIDSKNAGAIIEDETQTSSQYSIGDTLPGDAQLKAIHSDRVVLARNGVFETLYFPTDEQAGANSSGWSASRNVSTQEAAERRDAVRKRIQQLRGGGNKVRVNQPQKKN